MSTFYFGGIEKRVTAQILGQEKAAGMMSWLQYSPTLMSACIESKLSLVIDSGAYSIFLTESDIERYAALIILLGESVIWYAAPDCIGDQKKSNENYVHLLSLLPESLHSRILWIYQYGSDLKYLYKGLEQHRRIGVGGLVPLFQRNDRSVARQAVISLARVIGYFDCVPHYFGLSIPDVLADLHQYHEDFSVDSSTWLIGAKYGRLINNRGQQRPACEGGYDFSKEAILSQNIRTM